MSKQANLMLKVGLKVMMSRHQHTHPLRFFYNNNNMLVYKVPVCQRTSEAPKLWSQVNTVRSTVQSQ